MTCDNCMLDLDVYPYDGHRNFCGGCLMAMLDEARTAQRDADTKIARLESKLGGAINRRNDAERRASVMDESLDKAEQRAKELEVKLDQSRRAHDLTVEMSDKTYARAAEVAGEWKRRCIEAERRVKELEGQLSDAYVECGRLEKSRENVCEASRTYQHRSEQLERRVKELEAENARRQVTIDEERARVDMTERFAARWKRMATDLYVRLDAAQDDADVWRDIANEKSDLLRKAEKRAAAAEDQAAQAENGGIPCDVCDDDTCPVVMVRDKHRCCDCVEKLLEDAEGTSTPQNICAECERRVGIPDPAPTEKTLRDEYAMMISQVLLPLWYGGKMASPTGAEAKRADVVAEIRHMTDAMMEARKR